MIQRKHIVLVSTLLIVATLTSVAILESFTSNNSSSAVASLTSADIYPTTLIEESHLIEDVPYVSQETLFFCHYASCTMIFQRYGVETDLAEVLYYSGIGYSLLYPNNPILTPILGSYLISQQVDDNSFVASLYGLSFDAWILYPPAASDEECWNEYWTRVKQNISNDIPVETSVDPLSMPIIRQQFDVPENAWDYFGSLGHAIVLVGYNESNQTICFNDPAAAVIKDAQQGTYDWMNINDFKKAVKKRNVYIILRFEKTSDPLPKEEAFELAHERNIERLQGDHFAYDESFHPLQDYSFGIEALKELKDDFQIGLKHRLKTIFFYKCTGRILKKINRRNLFIKIWLQLPSSFIEFLSSSENEFDLIAIEKQYAANYLRSIDGAGDYNPEVTLLEREAEHWSQLSSYYNIFLKRGFFLSLPRAILIMKNMENTVDNIIFIEEDIIK